ncbi:iron ABC transporter permease, partial [Sphaerochaeta sp. S2]|nr:iron ABC transporter permease [Sphaerochaeta sp. S2]
MKKGLSATLALSSVLLMLLSLTLGPSNISLANTIAVLTGGETGGNQAY